MIRCAVVGASGYTGAEIAKILFRHSKAKLTSLTTRKEDILPLGALIPGLAKDCGIDIEEYHFEKVEKAADVVFLALPHTVSINFAAEFLRKGKIVIDLSADFRLKDIKLYEKWYGKRHSEKELLEQAVYGLPELYREEIKNADLIANPGCYPTAAILGLKPLVDRDLINLNSIIIDAKSGISGAGRKLIPGFLFMAVDEDFKAYKVNQHQHMPEIEMVLSRIANAALKVQFVPHLLPVKRGILETIYCVKESGVSKKQILSAFADAYEKEVFVRVRKPGVFPALGDVRNTNFCDIGVWTEDDSDRVIVVSVIDNLMKGASGQAVQNMNIRCGFPEATGLI
ncbi:MAG: N-acetyl-gamma-glutamyl-phosphate reductase [Candidatus Omnitrophica bacterium]|nr:N-acetyl-gamma-glutamyl-phosphate reductase [Candidatus Omnitrophota bacterium]